MQKKEPVCLESLKFHVPKLKGKAHTIDVTSIGGQLTAHEICQYLQKIIKSNYRNVECRLNIDETICYLQALNDKPHGSTWWYEAVRDIRKMENDHYGKKNFSLPNTTMVFQDNEKLLADKISLLFLLLNTKLESLITHLLNLQSESSLLTSNLDTIMDKILRIKNIFANLTQYHKDKSLTCINTQINYQSISDLITLATQIKEEIQKLRSLDVKVVSFKNGLYQYNEYYPTIKKIVNMLDYFSKSVNKGAKEHVQLSTSQNTLWSENHKAETSTAFQNETALFTYHN